MFAYVFKYFFIHWHLLLFLHSLFIFIYPRVYIYRYIHRYIHSFIESVFLMHLVWHLDCLVVYSWWMTLLIIHHWCLVYWFYHSLVRLQLTMQLIMVTLPAWIFFWRMEPTWRLKTMLVSPPTFIYIQTLDDILIYLCILLSLFYLNLYFLTYFLHSIVKDGKNPSMFARINGKTNCVDFLEVTLHVFDC